MLKFQGYTEDNLRSCRVYYQLQQLHHCNVYVATVMVQPAREVPPDYQTVVTMEEEDLPSYSQAVGSNRMSQID